VLHDPSISPPLIWSPYQYMAKGTIYEAHHLILSIVLRLPLP
jgi:hypothetical protein